MIKPGEKLSLYLQRKRAEHWVVVSGTAASGAATRPSFSSATSTG
ncbi:MAG TPA: hypothetical protein VGR43_03000 [Dehalococcoidia bacterium]|jgi:mannose-6-phosphate isomerase-like protein (cupin superfamily)|nr:hypothetical protein [Dehalococcoidia bacterium]